jgi:kynurenine formamidase
MRHTPALALALLLLAVAGRAGAQPWQPPSDAERCPSKWGAADRRGSANHMTPATVLRATRLIRTGEVFELGHVLSDAMPLFAGRRFELFTKRTRNDPGTNRRGSNEELVVAEIGQVGTQFDAFSHQTIGASLYNCVGLDEAASRTGFSQLGVEQVGALMTRAVLLDIAALKQVPVLAESYQITPQDLEQALAAQGLTLQPGDAVILHTGWGTLWGRDSARYQRASPGLNTAAAAWLAARDPMLVGADNSAVEVAPPEHPQLAGPVHQLLLVVHGIHLLENLRLEELAAKRVHEFALVVQPLKIKGGTGSTVAPIAIR